MTKRRRCDTAWTPFERGVLPDIPTAKVQPPDQLWMNSMYQVSVYRLEGDMGVIEHLSIKRRDRRVIRDWRHLQRIKNELCGPEREGVELFQAEVRTGLPLQQGLKRFSERLVSEDPGEVRTGLPLQQGLKRFSERLVSEDPGECGAVQRRFDEDCRPDDLVTAEEMNRKVQDAIEKK